MVELVWDLGFGGSREIGIVGATLTFSIVDGIEDGYWNITLRFGAGRTEAEARGRLNVCEGWHGGGQATIGEAAREMGWDTPPPPIARMTLASIFTEAEKAKRF